MLITNEVIIFLIYDINKKIITKIEGEMVMEINYTKEETIKLLEEYYRRLEDREVKVTITARKDCVGLYEVDGCVTTISVTEVMDIAGMQKEVKQQISEEEVTRNLRALFGLYEFDLTGLTLNDGLSSRYEGYGMMEHEVKSAYFKGITVNVNKKQNLSFGK